MKRKEPTREIGRLAGGRVIKIDYSSIRVALTVRQVEKGRHSLKKNLNGG